MSSFDWKKNIEDSLRDELIITIGGTGIFLGLKAANVKPPKASLDAMDIIKLTGGIWGMGGGGGFGGEGISERSRTLQEMDQRIIQQQKIL